MNDALRSVSAILQQDFQSELLFELTWLRASEETYMSTVSLRCTPLPDIEASRFLHPTEYQLYQKTLSHVRRSSFMRGRYCAKQALQYFLNSQPTDIHVANGVFGQPLVLDNCQNLGISIAHSQTVAAATAFPEQYPMGIDVEQWHPDLPSTLTQHWTPNERRLLSQANHSYQPLLFWSAKEALSKILKTGLTLPMAMLELLEPESTRFYQIIPFKNFSQYKAIAFSWGSFVLALVVPAKSELINCHCLMNSPE